jgi:hypothetical protein
MGPRASKLICPIFLFILFFLGCSSNNQPSSSSNSSGTSVPPPSATPTNASTNQDNSKVCALFTAADAQKIMGAPMALKPGHGKDTCLYEETTPAPNSIGGGTVALTLNQHSTAEEENRAWAQMKEVRHLEPGQKNVQVLSGIGDEAYFTGNIQKGKVGVAGVIVRKGNAHFAIDCMVLEYVASPDAMKAIAKRIADQL